MAGLNGLFGGFSTHFTTKVIHNGILEGLQASKFDGGFNVIFWTDFDWTGLIFGPKTQKTPLDHVLDSKMQTTRRVWAC